MPNASLMKAFRSSAALSVSNRFLPEGKERGQYGAVGSCGFLPRPLFSSHHPGGLTG